MIKSKKWLYEFVIVSLVLMLVMGIVIYSYDPFVYYRIPEKRLIVNNSRFINPGIVKNAQYDSVIIGSSMIQNFNMNSFRKKLNLNPVKLSVGALSIEGLELIISHVNTIGKASRAFICIDQPVLNSSTDKLETYPTYLYNNTKLDDYRYLLGYETWMRLFPLNIVFNIAEKFGAKIPAFYVAHSVDKIGEWHDDAKYGKEILIQDYLGETHQISSQNTDSILQRMKANADKVIQVTQMNPNLEVVYFFPPYSALMWYSAKTQGYYDAFQRIKKYFVEQIEKYPNARVFDFQSMPEVSDLDNYKDLTHYSADLNERMVECFSENLFIVDSISIENSISDLDVIVEEFAKDNLEWLKSD